MIKTSYQEKDYSHINDFLNDYCKEIDNTFFYAHLEQIYQLIKGAKDIIEKNTSLITTDRDSSLNGYDQLTKRLPYPETLQIVRGYIRNRVPEYQTIFEECLNNGVINLVIEKDESKNEDWTYFGYINGHHTVNCVLEHNYYDPCFIIHEFFHYLNDKNPNMPDTHARRLLSESISVFFEWDILKYMLDNGYDEKDIKSIINRRLLSCYEKCSSSLSTLSIMNCYKWLGQISDNTFEDEQNLQIPNCHISKEDFFQDIHGFSKIVEKRRNPIVRISYILGTVLSLACYAKNNIEMISTVSNLNPKLNEQRAEESLKIIGFSMETSDDIADLLDSFKIVLTRNIKLPKTKKK